MSQYLDKDGASRIAENFLSKQAEQDAILANLQFDLKEAEHALVKTIQGPAPLNIRALTRPLDNYVISGNTVQNGTPSPSDPVDVIGVGERTKNIYNTQETVWIENTLDDDGNPTGSVTSHYTGNFTAVKPNTLYYISKIAESTEGGHRIYYYDSDKNWIGRSVLLGYNDYRFTTVSGCKYIQIQIGSTIVNTDNWMISEGPSQVSFEPYGYKLPLTVNGTEYPIYLGQVPTTRRIKKVVFDGTEQGWGKNTGLTNSNAFLISMSNWVGNRKIGYCTHYQNVTDAQAAEGIFFGNSLNILTAFADGLDDATKFKQYLATQYAAGTPVTVWYVLATPTTGIVNEPLMKIGDYADTISMAQAGVEISTTKGFNTITTDTTVLPSNIEVKGVINNA